MPPASPTDRHWMARCLDLAERGAQTVSPNPMVGAVVLDANGQWVAEGFHRQAGGPHAEVWALDAAGERARGGTLYVSLEPCNHQGRTPACTERILASGVSRVVYGLPDPNPQAAGGHARLASAGLSVEGGVLAEACAAQNVVFCHGVSSSRPWVSLKLALTLDGAIATRSGHSQWLTGPLTRQAVHYHRARHDALLTTAATVQADNPALTVREVPAFGPPPARVVLDRALRLKPGRHRILNIREAPTWVVSSQLGERADVAANHIATGVKLLHVPETGQGLDLSVVLETLYHHGVRSVWVEAGGQLASSLLHAGLVDRLHLVYAPRVLADPAAMPAFEGTIPRFRLGDADHLELLSSTRIADDLWVTARPMARPGGQ